MSQEPNDEFFELVDEDVALEEPLDSRARWISVGIVLLAVVVSIFLCVAGIRALSAAKADAGYEDKTWVMSGKFVDLTPDLQTKSNVAKYAGTLPADEQLNGLTFKSDLADSQQVNAGSAVEFRGSQTGSVRSDFPQEVDALLAKTADNQLEVVRTGALDSLQPITSASVRNAQLAGWVCLFAALLVFFAGVVSAVWVTRRVRAAYADDFEDRADQAESK